MADHATSHTLDRLRQRKARTRTSCDPCRARKVKCDRALPCDKCIKSEYADLCIYKGDRNRPAGHATSTPSPAPPRPHSREAPPSGRQRLDRSSSPFHLSQPRLPTSVGQHVASDLPEDGQPEKQLYLGDNSLPTFLSNRNVVDTHESSAGDYVRDAVMPLLGIELPRSKESYFPPDDDRELETIRRISRSLPANHEIVQ